MKEKLRIEIDKTLEHIRDITSAIKDKSSAIPEETKILWEHSKDKIPEINDKLNQALDNLHVKSDEALLQAHLASMEAHSTWDRTRNAVESFTRKTARQTKTEIDHTALQAHLARLDAEDFMETRGKTLAPNFETSRDKVKTETLEAVKELQEYFGKIAKGFSKVD